MNKNILIKLINIAEDLDNAGFYKESDVLTNVMFKYSQVAGPQNLSLPMSVRVIPWGEIYPEIKEFEKNKLDHPRLIPKPFEQDSPTDEADEEGSIFSLNGEPVSGITQRIYDPKGAGYMGMEQFEWGHRDDNKKGYPTYSPN